jgi:hypothetical protein
VCPERHSSGKTGKLREAKKTRRVETAGFPYWRVRTTTWRQPTTILGLKYCRSDIGRAVLGLIASASGGLSVTARGPNSSSQKAADGSDQIELSNGLLRVSRQMGKSCKIGTSF